MDAPPLPKDQLSDRSSKVEHALKLVGLQWDAEQENSRRLANRANGVLATIALLSGLGIFKVPEIGAIEPAWVKLAAKICIGVVALCLFFGLVHILDLRPPRKTEDEEWWRLPRKAYRLVRKISRPTDDGPESQGTRHAFASSLLQGRSEPGSPNPVEDPDLLQLKLDAIRETHYYRLALASMELHVRNVERQAAILRGQAWLGHAAVAAFVMAVILAVSR